MSFDALLRSVFLIAALLVASPSLVAFDESGAVGGLSFRVLGPDVCRAGDGSNVLVILEAGAGEAVSARLRLRGGRVGTELTQLGDIEVRVPSGGLERRAFRSVELVKSEPDGGEAPAAADERRVLELEISVDAEAKVVRIELAVVRGAMVSEGIWSILLPVLFSLVAVPWAAILICRHAKPRAWRTVELARGPAAEEAWWTEVS